MAQRSRQVCVVGTGYVGVATAVGLAELGHRVAGYDVIHERVTGLAAGMPPYREGNLTARLRAQLGRGRLSFQHDLATAAAGADFVIICVGTPSRLDGSADMSALHEALESVGGALRGPGTIVIRSTVPCGTTDLIASNAPPFHTVLYAPEFLREGHALDDFLNPDRIVIGAGHPEDASDYAALFAEIERPVVVTSYRNAELIKVSSNAFLAMKVTFANEVANLCDRLDADALDVLAGVGSDRRIGAAFLAPGIGFGGPCFEKDLKSLRSQAHALHVHGELVEATLRANDRQPLRVVEALARELGTLRDTVVAVWGLAFKAGTDDLRDSLAIRVVDELHRRGARVVAHDPAIAGAHPMVKCEMRDTAEETLDQADALLVLTEWPAFAAVPPAIIAGALRRGVVVDGRNVLDGAGLAACGIRYQGIGRRFGDARVQLGQRAASVG
ncbi:MAG: UDP-glucose/GDP-mannose dehydrogenase family protein [Vulcanimicrobiaceae bacterium]|jgi:UDPglucose 6-dehydrogenase